MFKTTFIRFLYDRSGQFSLIFGLSISVLLLIVSLAFESNRFTTGQLVLNDTTDSAALAGAAAVMNGDADPEIIAKDVFFENLNAEFSSVIIGDPSITIDRKLQEVTVEVETERKVWIPVFTERNSVKNHVISVATYGQDSSVTSRTHRPVSVMLLADRSGSMAGILPDGSRMKRYLAVQDCLHLFIETLANRTSQNPEVTKGVRAGLIGWNAGIGPKYPLKYGWQHFERNIRGLTPKGGTNMSHPLRLARLNFEDDRKTLAQSDSEFVKNALEVVVMLSDGQNGKYANANKNSISECNAMKAQGVVIYTIAFNAPPGGQKLLRECATDETTTYFYGVGLQEIREAFKTIVAQLDIETDEVAVKDVVRLKL